VSNVKLTTIRKYGQAYFIFPMGISFSEKSNLIYVTDYGSDQLIALNSNGTFRKAVSVADPVSITTTENAIFVSNSLTVIYKFDLALNFIKRISGCNFYGLSGPCLRESRGLHYDKSSGLIYNADSGAQGVHVFDEELNRSGFISLPSLNPYSVYATKGQLFVGEWNKILVLENNSVKRVVNQVCMNSTNIRAIGEYDNDEIIVNCFIEKRIHILSPDLSPTNQYLYPSAGSPRALFIHKNRIFTTTELPDGINIYEVPN